MHLCITHLCDFLPSAPPGPDPQSWAWIMKVYSFCDSQSTRPRALSWPSPDVPFSTTASNGDSTPWMLNAHISPRDQAEGNGGVRFRVWKEGWGVKWITRFQNHFCCWWDIKYTQGSSDWIRLPVLLLWKQNEDIRAVCLASALKMQHTQHNQLTFASKSPWC